MNTIVLIGKYFWIVFILITFLNVFFMKKSSKEAIAKKPLLEKSYNQIFKAMLTWGNLPWIVMGVGILTHHVPTMFHYFRPQDQNLYVLAFFISILIIYIQLAYWILFKKGGEILLEHGSFSKYGDIPPLLIKILAVVNLVFFFVFITILYKMDFPVDKVFLELGK